MRYLRNREFARQTVLSLIFWAAAVLAGLALFPEERACIVFFGVLSILLLLFWILFTCRRYRRLEKLALDADRLLHGERSLDLTQYQEGELAILANELQKMLAHLSGQSSRLQKEKEYLSDSLADISHQLRTPLTTLNLLLARLAGETDERNRRRLVYEASQLLERTVWLVEALLKIARIDAGTAVFATGRVDASELVRTALTPFGIPMEIHGQEAKLELQEQAGFSGDADWTAEALSNIIKNCLEHMGEGGILTIRTQENNLYTEFVIEDDGPGFSPEDLPHLFERFYRGKQSSGLGVGIGLALARMIVNAENGMIRAENRTEGGARFVLRFYKGIV